MKKTRKGLTLVELLVCMVVLAILAAVLMMSSKEALSSAKAARIINNLNILKTAALAWYNDNGTNYDVPNSARDRGVDT